MSYTLIYIPSASNHASLAPGQHLVLGQNMDEAEAVKAAVQDVVHLYSSTVLDNYNYYNTKKNITTQGELVEHIMSAIIAESHVHSIGGFYFFYNRLQADHGILDDYIFVNAELARSRDFNAGTPL